MFAQNTADSPIILPTTIKLDFTRTGLKKFLAINERLGKQFIRGPILFHELKYYLAAYEAYSRAGAFQEQETYSNHTEREQNKHHVPTITLDESCQLIRYDNRIVLILRKVQGTWYITDVYATDVYATDVAVTYQPVFFWKLIKRGVRMILAHVLYGWTARMEKSRWERDD